MRIIQVVLLVGTTAIVTRGRPARAKDAPADALALHLSAPVKTWEEGIPLGNGLTGGLLWGESHTINLSLDRGDLWDERLPEIYRQAGWNYDTIKRLKAAGNQQEISRRFDAPYNQYPYPTKLPVGRLVLTFDETQQAKTFSLDMREAVGRVELTRSDIECFFSATAPVAFLRIRGPAPSLHIVRPDGLDRLGYAPAHFVRSGNITSMVQKAAEGLSYGVVIAEQHREAETLLAISIVSSTDGADLLAIGSRRVRDALDAGYAASFRSHRRWWEDFWVTSAVTIPDARLQKHYNLVKYFYGAASRVGAPPMPLQGVWTRDDGNLPPWKGDFHNDLNTQMTYLAYQTAGLFEAGRSFLDYQWQLLPAYRRFARQFYGVDGAIVPGVATLGGKPAGGWSQYALSPTNGLWVGQSFYLHWRYTMDRDFLANRAYPWLSEITTGVVNLLQEREGKLYLPLSSSPEIHNNSLRAWLTPNSNYDLALLQWAFDALGEMAAQLERPADVAHWRTLREKLDDLLIDHDNVLMFAKGEPFRASHRHHSHAMAIHPLGTLNVEGNAHDRAVIDATLDRMEKLGTRAWVGYSFSWFACMLARAGRPDEALRYLTDYERAFILRNGFHVNGDQIGAGLSAFRYHPFTLEGNFLAMQAIQEMLLQSWGGRVRVFPALPHAWADVAFDRLRAEGGFIVSARRTAGTTKMVRIVATTDQPLRLKNPFGEAPFHANRPIERTGDELRCDLRKGETLELLAADARQTREDGDVLTLAGQWTVRLDPTDAGERGRWFAAPLGGSPISLPGTTDLAGLGYHLDHPRMTYPVAARQTGFSYKQHATRLDEVGHLVREYFYVGKAWYQRTFDVPQRWSGKRVRIRLERVIWKSDLWLDDHHVGSCDSLVAPHEYDLGTLEPGQHRLTIRIDNGPIHKIGIIGHAYGPETQSRWNGIVGTLELVATDPIFLERLDVFPATDRTFVRIRAAVSNQTGRAAHGRLRLVVTGTSDDSPAGVSETQVRIDPGDSVIERRVSINRPVRAWDEFHPVRYTLHATLDMPGSRHTLRQLFGFRHIERNGRHIEVNGRRIFLRGTLDCCVYPRTGHPPMTVDRWLDVLGTIKRYGFNHVRFHTWCPPEAAFEAADQLGLYLAPETPFWVDNWTTGVDPKPSLFGADEDVVRYVRDEIRRISAAYGNHPSFTMFCIGNEFGANSDWQLLNRLVEQVKQRDPRRLYTASTARKHVSADDYWVTHSTGKVATRGVGPARTNWDFSKATGSVDVPLIAHETGQRPVFPDYANLLPKFTGPLKPYNLCRYRDQLAAAGRLDQVPRFEQASARFQLVQYKAEHEAFHRTPNLGGYELLMLNDFTGQSEALVGILDPFWESKGVIGVDEVRSWNAPTVALARFARTCYTSDETFEASLEVAHFGPRDLPDATARWMLQTRDGNLIARGSLGPCLVPAGGITRFGRFSVPWGSVASPAEVVLRVRVGDALNAWRLWVYPPPDGAEDAGDVSIAGTFDDHVLEMLADGRSVLLLTHGLKTPFAATTGFLSVYWSAGWWGNEFSALGIVCDPSHPALARFPNDGYSDWQWRTLTQGATTMRLAGAPPDLHPIVEAIPDFHYNQLLAQVFEVRIGPGRLLVCGYDLATDLEHRHAARQFRRSLLAYMNSSAFHPSCTLDPQTLRTWLTPPPPASQAR